LFTQLYTNLSSGVAEYWPLIFEKAYAKLHNGYSSIESGWAVEAIVDMTCGVPEEFAHDNEDVKSMIFDGSYW